jgi:hypothetical protein
VRNARVFNCQFNVNCRGKRLIVNVGFIGMDPDHCVVNPKLPQFRYPKFLEPIDVTIASLYVLTVVNEIVQKSYLQLATSYR